MVMMIPSRRMAGSKPKITVVGVGGGGGNAVDNMIAQNLSGVDFLVANTDAQALAMSRARGSRICFRWSRSDPV